MIGLIKSFILADFTVCVLAHRVNTEHTKKILAISDLESEEQTKIVGHTAPILRTAFGNILKQHTLSVI